MWRVEGQLRGSCSNKARSNKAVTKHKYLFQNWLKRNKRNDDSKIEKKIICHLFKDFLKSLKGRENSQLNGNIK